MIELPTMTHPLSAHWHQPNADQMAVYDDIAIMDRSALNSLSEYSLSIPSGVYEGKMWKRKSRDGWQLCWYGPSDKPDEVSINNRPIRLLQNGESDL